MNQFRATDVFLALGRRGSGKSYLARKISAAYPRRVIFDPLGEYLADDGFHCHSFQEFGQKILETEGRPKFDIIFHFDVEREDQIEEFNQALRVCWYRGNVMVHIEEIQEFSTPHRMPHWLRAVLLTGRHQGLACFFTTQRPGECHKTVLSQSGHVFIGSLHDRNDLDYVKPILGDRAALLSSLPEREFYYFRPGKPLLHIDNDLTIKN